MKSSITEFLETVHSNRSINTNDTAFQHVLGNYRKDWNSHLGFSPTRERELVFYKLSVFYCILFSFFSETNLVVSVYKGETLLHINFTQIFNRVSDTSALWKLTLIFHFSQDSDHCTVGLPRAVACVRPRDLSLVVSAERSALIRNVIW